MITKEDLIRFLRESGAQLSIEDQLHTWNVSGSDFDEFIDTFVQMVIQRHMRERDSLTLLIYSTFWSGFEIGYKAALENETKRILDNDL